MLEPNLFAPFIVPLERLGIPYFITGSTAGILYGEPRLTHDVDIVIALSARHVHAFVEAFPLQDVTLAAPRPSGDGYPRAGSGARARCRRRKRAAARRAALQGTARQG